MKRYNIINNVLGWVCFVIAAATYLLTLEPTASFWDCPEFISQGYKLEIGHPPGNPIFMLTARFFVTLFGGGASTAALAVNSMSALLSAATILLLFWTITHLTRRLIVDDKATEISWAKTVIIMASGLCGALMYTWSDTFWFSAVEGEVYAFSSFCTALVIWLALKWENRADEPHSDRYLVLIAYVIGISIAVHLLNLLCIPAIVLIFYYRKYSNINVKGSLAALAVSVVIIALILYGLVPGFIKVAGQFELFFVNTVGMSYNMGVLIYAILTVITFVWTIRELYTQHSAARIKAGAFLSVILSGMPFIGHGFWIPFVLIIAMAVYLWGFCKKVPVRVFNVIITGIFVIFIGYSSYALLLIRATADTPMNQNAPDNVFSLASYLNREQYGDTPLLYGQVYAEELSTIPTGQYDDNGEEIYVVPVNSRGIPALKPIQWGGVMMEDGLAIDVGEDEYTKVVKTSPDQKDKYVLEVHKPSYVYSPDVKMLFTRMYSSDQRHIQGYKGWSESTIADLENIPVEVRRDWASRGWESSDYAGFATVKEITHYLTNEQEFDLGTEQVQDQYGNVSSRPAATWGYKPSMWDNLRYFFNYQLNHMYWRYFMWNFAGRQNDIQGEGQPHLGNWISGIPLIDNTRLGDQSLLPAEYGSANKGHNVFYMLPLLLGLLGILWQSLSRHRHAPNRGIEQFWVVFFLFFMTGIAIVLYLNQTPGQPRERDYAFAGSFYAYAIWVGMGVAAIHAFITEGLAMLKRKKNADGTIENVADVRLAKPVKWAVVGVACVFAIGVPLQVVSQTWDDHDRSGRYTARDFGMNYLNSLDPNAIIFTNGDNDTFPLWYAQEVEGVRTDVKVVNLMYLTADWYANQTRMPSYEAQGVPMWARPEDYAYGKYTYIMYPGNEEARQPIEVSKALKEFYDGSSPYTKETLDYLRQRSPGSDFSDYRYLLATPNMYAKLDSVSTYEAFGKYPELADSIHGGAYMPLDGRTLLKSSNNLSNMLTFDIVANSAANGWKRPVYIASTVGDRIYNPSNWPYLHSTGMAYMVTPFDNRRSHPLTDKAYTNIMTKFLWGGLDKGKDLYLDETVRRMVTSTRYQITGTVEELMDEGDKPASPAIRALGAVNGLPVPANKYDMARNILDLISTRMPESVAPYDIQMDVIVAELYARLGHATGNAADLDKAKAINDRALDRYADMLRYGLYLHDVGRDANLTRDDRTSMNLLLNALGLANFIELDRAYINKGDVNSEIGNQMDVLADNIGSGYLYFYLLDLTDEEIEAAAKDGADDSTLNQLKTLSDAHKTLGVDRNAIRDNMLKRHGFTADRWANYLYGR